MQAWLQPQTVTATHKPRDCLDKLLHIAAEFRGNAVWHWQHLPQLLEANRLGRVCRLANQQRQLPQPLGGVLLHGRWQALELIPTRKHSRRLLLLYCRLCSLQGQDPGGRHCCRTP